MKGLGCVGLLLGGRRGGRGEVGGRCEEGGGRGPAEDENEERRRGLEGERRHGR